MSDVQKIRNIAIIAHVDHGKTTIIDSMFKQAGVFRNNQSTDDRLMDSNEIEKERGITILAKCTSIEWQDYHINIIDTPGHADFGGEVERILSMVDCVLLLVDSAEGPLPQTKFVLSKALSLGLRPIVIINKIDRQDAQPDEVLNQIFDLFVSLGANDQQLDFPILYAVGRDGWCVDDLAKVNSDEPKDLTPLFELIVKHVPCPKANLDAPFSMLVTLIDADSFVGRMLIGKIESGRVHVGQDIKAINVTGEHMERGKLTKLFTFAGPKRIPAEEAAAGEIVCIAGLTKASVADTICDPAVTEAIPALPIDPPTMAVTISVNDSPFAGKDGSKVTSRLIRERLFAEAEKNVAIVVEDSSASGDAFEVKGRGELQLGILIETMRREGFELSVSRPRILFQTDAQGNKLEPVEEIVVDVDNEFASAVIDKISQRKGIMQDMQQGKYDKTRITFLAPSRGLIGYQSEFLTDTRGTGILNRVFHSYEPYKGDLSFLRTGVIISNDQGQAVAYAIWYIQERGVMFINPGDDVYEGMIIGQNAKSNDMEVNILKTKNLTNIRASGSDEAIRLVPPKTMTLEQMITFIQDDELVEVTPKHLRLRKKILSSIERKKNKRNN